MSSSRKSSSRPSRCNRASIRTGSPETLGFSSSAGPMRVVTFWPNAGSRSRRKLTVMASLMRPTSPPTRISATTSRSTMITTMVTITVKTVSLSMQPPRLAAALWAARECLLPKHTCRFREFLQFHVRFVERNRVDAAGRETAIGVQRDSICRQILQCSLHAGNNVVRRLALGTTDIQASQAEPHMLRQCAQDFHAASLGHGELQGQFVDAGLAQGGPDRREIAGRIALALDV